MRYAVIRTGGKQYKVAEGDVVEVERIEQAPDSKITFDVLLVAGGDAPLIGTPLVANALVTGKVLGEVKGEKIRVSKYKAKVRYRRTTGHRQLLTRIQIESIGDKKEKSASKTTEATEEKPARASRTTKKAVR